MRWHHQLKDNVPGEPCEHTQNTRKRRRRRQDRTANLNPRVRSIAEVTHKYPRQHVTRMYVCVCVCAVVPALTKCNAVLYSSTHLHRPTVRPGPLDHGSHGNRASWPSPPHRHHITCDCVLHVRDLCVPPHVRCVCVCRICYKAAVSTGILANVSVCCAKVVRLERTPPMPHLAGRTDGHARGFGCRH